MKCKNCGVELEKSDKFCQHCGAEVTVEQDESKKQTKENKTFYSSYNTSNNFYGKEYDSTNTNVSNNNDIFQGNSDSYLKYGIMGLIFSLVLPIAVVGLIFSIIGLKSSKKGFAIGGLIISILRIFFILLFIIIIVVLTVNGIINGTDSSSVISTSCFLLK